MMPFFNLYVSLLLSWLATNKIFTCRKMSDVLTASQQKVSCIMAVFQEQEYIIRMVEF